MPRTKKTKIPKPETVIPAPRQKAGVAVEGLATKGLGIESTGKESVSAKVTADKEKPQKEEAKEEVMEEVISESDLEKQISSKPERYFEATGRRKTSVARVRLFTR